MALRSLITRHFLAPTKRMGAPPHAGGYRVNEGVFPFTHQSAVLRTVVIRWASMKQRIHHE
jgi:hypothetical protein